MIVEKEHETMATTVSFPPLWFSTAVRCLFWYTFKLKDDLLKKTFPGCISTSRQHSKQKHPHQYILCILSTSKGSFFIPNTWEVEWMWGTDNASSIRTRGRKGWEEKRVTDHKRGTWQKYGLFFLDCLNISTKHSCIVVLLCPWKSEYGATNRLYLW